MSPKLRARDGPLRTISVRLPIAHALLVNGCGIVGKYHKWADKRFGLQCSTQGGANANLRSELVLAGLIPGIRNVQPPLMGHVFASARVLGRVSTLAALYALANGHVDVKHVRAWIAINPGAAHYYVLTDVRPCAPVRWRGVMSCFPVPASVFA